MPPKRLNPTLIDSARAAFLAGPVAINVASRSHDLVPSIARGFGCRVTDDGREVVVFLAVSRSQAVLRDLRGGAPVAAIFSRPKTHESLQLKGPRAEVSELGPRDREIMRAYGAAFAGEIQDLGYTQEFAQVLTAGIAEEAVGVRFAPDAVFDQTPGPHAGKRL